MSMIGKTLAHYEITSQLGKGGMGEVYRAKDQMLGRDVAIKVLPEEFARDADRVARFQREAKLLASLNHPNIAAIYGLEESNGTKFLVLELVAGDTLADHLTRGAIPVEESLKLALQIAEALEAAHEKGVIHRDLKPANIKVTPDGKVKVLDFGLAKAFAGEQAEMNLSASPTLSHLATQQGIILGTAAYMSPEQARGKPADKRADIWAFGCVLFEMLTGLAAFRGEDVGEILASVIKADTQLVLLPAETSQRLRQLLNRCLQKDLRNRYQDIGDVRFELGQVAAHWSEAPEQPVDATERKSKLRLVLPWVGLAVVLTAAAATLISRQFKPAESHPVTRFSYLLPKESALTSSATKKIAISPDGSRVAFATSQGIYLQSLDQYEGRIIPGSESNSSCPFFSPDGQNLGYWSSTEKQLKKISIGGGAPMSLCGVEQVIHAFWGSDNTIIFDGSTGISRVSASGGIPTVVLKEPRAGFFAPQVLPDGKSLLFTARYPGERDTEIDLQSLVTGKRKTLLQGSGARYLGTGYLVFARGAALFAVPFDISKLEVTGEPVPLIQDVSAVFVEQYAISDSGTLAYIPNESTRRTLAWVDRNGREEALETPPMGYAMAKLSPDGTRIALQGREMESGIWIWDIGRKSSSRLPFDTQGHVGFLWTPDGKQLAFIGDRDGKRDIFVQSADGSGLAEPLTNTPNAPEMVPQAFSPDAKQILFLNPEGNTAQWRMGIYHIGGGTPPTDLLPGSNPQISPDGRWLAYESRESGSTQVWVRPFPNINAGRWQISSDGGTRPLWNRNGRELFYYLVPGTIMSVPVETGASFKAGISKVVFKGYYESPLASLHYSVTADGQKFLMIKKPGAGEGQRINIVLNWLEELKQRVPIK